MLPGPLEAPTVGLAVAAPVDGLDQEALDLPAPFLAAVLPAPPLELAAPLPPVRELTEEEKEALEAEPADSKRRRRELAPAPAVLELLVPPEALPSQRHLG